MTVADLQQMKRDKKKIAAAVVYDRNMVQIVERAGADLLSVGDSVGTNLLGYSNPDQMSFEEMTPFIRAVARSAERAVVSSDLPRSVCNAGPVAVQKVVRELKEWGVDMVKVDIRRHEEELIDEIQAVIEAGLACYPQIGFATFPGEATGAHGSPEDHEYVLKWAHAVEDRGASIVDLSQTSAEIYADVCRTLRIPVMNGPAVPEADGKILVLFGAAGYAPSTMERSDPPSAAKVIFDIAEHTISEIHAGRWAPPTGGAGPRRDVQ